MSNLEYRTVTMEARVLSGSDEHAEWSVYWALQNNEYVEDIYIDKLEVNYEEQESA